MVGQIFKYYYTQMAKIAFICPSWLEEFSIISTLKWLKLHLNSPPGLKKFLSISTHKWLKLHLNSPPWLRNYEISVLLDG